MSWWDSTHFLFLTFFSRCGEMIARARILILKIIRAAESVFFFCFFFVLQSASSHMTPNVVSTHLTGSVWSWSDAVTSASNPIAKVREGSLNLCCYTQLNDLVVDELSRNWSHNSHTHRIVSPFRRAAADVHWLVSCNFHHLDLLYTQLRTLYNTETIQWNSSCCCIYDCERLGNVKRKGMKQCRLVLCQWNIK